MHIHIYSRRASFFAKGIQKSNVIIEMMREGMRGETHETAKKVFAKLSRGFVKTLTCGLQTDEKAIFWRSLKFAYVK